MNIMNKKGIARFGDFLSNLGSGKFRDYTYVRNEIPEWSVKEKE
jgi:hypothetical protein